MIELTQQQQQAMDASPKPAQLIDPRTNKTYVLIEADLYGRIRDLLLEENDGLSMGQVAVLVDRAMQEDDAGDPTLAYYQQKYGRDG
jgi:hypothetical protein